MTILYGIKNCDTVKKTRNWLEQQQINYSYHDFRIDGFDKKILTHWLTSININDILNTRSKTWRELADKDKSNLTDSKLVKLILSNTTMIKRPVLEIKTDVYVGFSEKSYLEIFN